MTHSPPVRARVVGLYSGRGDVRAGAQGCARDARDSSRRAGGQVGGPD